MKKLKYLLLILLMPVIASAATGSSGMSYSECHAFSDYSKNITGSYEYKYCYKAGCSSQGTWNYINMMSSSGYRCSNGNPEPYTKWTSDGCAKFTGSCKANDGVYCTRVKYVDCDRKSDGSSFGNPKTTTTTKAANPRVTTKDPNKPSKTRVPGTGSGITIPVTTTEATGEVTRPSVETEPIKSNNLNINMISINGTDLKYINGYDEYTIKLPYGVLDLEVFVSTEDDKTVTYVEGAYNMPDEDTTVNIKVVAEDGSEKNIKINVKRYVGESGDCNLSNISITDYELKNFDKNNYQYNLKVDRKTKSLYMDIIPSDPLHATVEVLGNNNLSNNSVITINVKAENGTLCTYHISIKKTSGAWIPVLIIILITAALIAGGYFVYRYIKRSKDTYQYE